MELVFHGFGLVMMISCDLMHEKGWFYGCEAKICGMIWNDHRNICHISSWNDME